MFATSDDIDELHKEIRELRLRVLELEKYCRSTRINLSGGQGNQGEKT